MGIFGDADHVRARFFGSLAAAIDTGMPSDQALELVATDTHSFSATEKAMDVAAGSSLSDNLARRGCKPFEVQAVRAGEQAGRLPDVLHGLSRYSKARGQAADRIASGMIYPLILLHGAVLLPPLFLLFRDGLAVYLSTVVPLLLLLYVMAAALWWLVRRGLVGGKLERVILSLPLVGEMIRGQAVADYAALFGMLFSAGIPTIQALDQAARANRWITLRGAGHRVARAVRSGATLAESLTAEATWFTTPFVAAIHVGETAGKLEEALEQATALAQDEADRARGRLVLVLPSLAFVIGVGIVAWAVFGFWLGLAAR